jgi:hypothetical protein
MPSSPALAAIETDTAMNHPHAIQNPKAQAAA